MICHPHTDNAGVAAVALEIKDLVFGYGERKVLDGFSFKAAGNKVISILGPNGVGKTTLLKCICGFIKPQSGSVEVDGKNIRDMSSRELARHIGYVPQKCPVPHTTVFDAVLIGRRPYIEWGARADGSRSQICRRTERRGISKSPDCKSHGSGTERADTG